MEYVTLSNGVKMPILGYGAMVPVEMTEKCVLNAVESGYRLIDTAQGYFNEEQVGNALKKCDVSREELFITTKMWVFSEPGYEKGKVSIDESLKKLQMDYIDLMLIHQPFGDYYGEYRALEEAYKAGKIRAIGVSNFVPDRLADIASFTEIPPMVNQVETNPFCQQKKARSTMEKYNIVQEAWSPFAEGKNNLFENEVLLDIAKKHGKTLAQIVLRFDIQNGVVAIPSSKNEERMKENLNIFDFELDAEDMQRIEALDTAKSLFFDYMQPETVDMVKGFAK